MGQGKKLGKCSVKESCRKRDVVGVDGLAFSGDASNASSELHLEAGDESWNKVPVPCTAIRWAVLMGKVLDGI